jgi:acyl-coenzyme A thioesterase PaaI-like protein
MADRRRVALADGRARMAVMGDESSSTSAGEIQARPAYPPEKHFLKDLDSATWQITADRVLMSAPLTDGHRNAAGSAALGFLAAMVDIAAAPVALIAGAPGWTATQDMSLHAAGWLTQGPAVVDARMERVGKNTVIVSVDVYDGAGVTEPEAQLAAVEAGELELTGKGLLTFARIPRAASQSADVFDPASLVGQQRTMPPVEPVVGTMLERLGVEVVDADGAVVEIAHSEYVRNSFGTINGGVLGAVFQAAAEAARPGLVATDLQIHYLAQMKVGPARTSGTVSRDVAGHSIVSLRAVDAGNDDQLLDLATITLQEPPT